MRTSLAWTARGAITAVAILLSYAAGGVAMAQSGKITVVDAQCRAQKVSQCMAALDKEKCWFGGGVTRGATEFGITPETCTGSPPNTPWRSKEEICTIRVDAQPAAECMRMMDFDKLIATQAETNTILRSDMRLLLNGFCKTYSPKPEACDTALPLPK
ncbi:hypothetical protein [Bosea sp. RAC05]|uniref:hypothetical protein n=1 Tax=Bosea sp. RAC05 TaxID=1842539 RepID=UPI0008571A9E|nr:hypothetical protein [Bosea sp. RAC05]AOG03067.1 hypothetical protein BSY19_4763 [Bosea sp. RAC05]